MGYSLPRHGARIRTKTQKKQKLRADCKLAQKKYRKKNYMMHEQFKCHDACSNAVRLSPS